MKKARQSFGHQLLAEQLTQRIQHHFAGNTNATDKSLTIGIFGEWGSGKSNLLHLIDETYRQSKPETTLIVTFNPWRFEREQHLLIPLLKSIQFTARKAVRDKENSDLKKSLMKIDEFLERSAMAFAQAEKNGIGLAIENGGAAKQANENSPENTFDLGSLDSMYYEFESAFQAITEHDTHPIQLLVLIDDLDRCRPEKAVEMLECMKLFLDVEHCVFIVALDDEVVERGILYRYRDYLLPTSSSQSTNTPLPITGIEYLEKIIQLPFRIPQPAKQEIAGFLQTQYPELFACNDNDDDGITQRQHLVKNNASKRELLDLFVSLIPAIPRKLIRASELLKLSLEMAKARGCETQIQPLPLAKIVLLQLFAPDLYRYGRRRYSGFLTTLENWSQKPYWRQRDFRACLENDYQISEAENADEAIQLEKRNFHRYYHDLLDAFESAAKNRTGFDLYQFIQQAQIGMEHLEPYFCFVEGENYEPEPRPSPKAVVTLPVAKISNQEEILDLLFSSTQGSWQSALQRPEFAGKTLDDALFTVIFERLNSQPFEHFLHEIDWLCLLCPHLSLKQFQQLLAISNDFAAILVTEKGQDLQRYFAQTQLLKALRREQQSLLSTAMQTTRETLLNAMQDATQTSSMRVNAGRALGELGDTRTGVSAIETSAGELPDIDWVKIALSGTPSAEQSPTLDPAHYSEYLISRYPITNAQYRCFVEDGGYQDLNIWNQLPKAARWWRNGKIDNPKLINLIEDDADRLFYQQWLDDDATRHEPRFWHDTKWNNDNHPVVGICWYEALAFTVWLSGKQQSVIPQGFINDNCEIRLPSEDEWEFAARGKEGHKHVWGEQAPNTQLANYAASGFEHTTPVGMYPASSSYGLFDMAGNTWDWTCSRWGKQFAQSDFSYEGWDDNAQRQERNLLDPIEFRTIRGASWLDSENYIRGDVRFRDHPLNRYDGIGFRIVYGLKNTPAEATETPNTSDDEQVLSQFLID